MAESTQYQKVKEITERLEAGIQELFNSEKFKTWLNTMSRFHDYSLNNTILICMQKPDASLVAGYTAWQKNFGRQVQKGEKAIKILAPTPYKKKMEVDKQDPMTGEILKNPDGSSQKETKEILMPAFKVVSVFDVSSTEGRPIPTLGVEELGGNVRQFEAFFEALERSCPVRVSFEDIAGGAKGYFHTVENRIALQEGMSEAQTVKTMIHEMTHQKLHSIDPKAIDLAEPKLTRNSKEVEAESVAYTVCQHFGIDTSDYSFAYIAGWSHGKDTPELKASMDRIRRAANEMITDIDGHFRAILMERGEPVPERSFQAEILAEELVALQKDIAPYEYADAVDDPEAAVAQIKESLLADDISVGVMIDNLYGSIISEVFDDPNRIDQTLQNVRAFLGEDSLNVKRHMEQPGYGVDARQENAMYRYYSTQRPVAPGTFPKPPENPPQEIQNFDQREPVEGTNFVAWGYLEYDLPLTEKQCSDYELRPAPTTYGKDAAKEELTEKKSILADLKKSQEKPITPDTEKKPKKTKHKEETR